MAWGVLIGVLVGFVVGVVAQTNRLVREREQFRSTCLHDGHSAEDCVRIFP